RGIPLAVAADPARAARTARVAGGGRSRGAPRAAGRGEGAAPPAPPATAPRPPHPAAAAPARAPRPHRGRLGAPVGRRAGAEWGAELGRGAASGSDVVFRIDVSASMDARDVPPSRIEEARREALSLLERLGGSRVGVVAFAGDAVRLCPLTLDRGAVRLVIES